MISIFFALGLCNSEKTNHFDAVNGYDRQSDKKELRNIEKLIFKLNEFSTSRYTSVVPKISVSCKA